MREQDPATRQLLAELLRLEASPWPAARSSYSAVLIALADRCSTKSAKAEVYRWVVLHAGGVLVDRDDRRRECLVDALHEAVTLAPSIFLRFRGGLDGRQRPNLRSMLAAWIKWRAGDFFESRHRRHRRHAEASAIRGPMPARPPSPETAAGAREVVRLLHQERDAASRGLLLHGLGDTIAEAARRTGASRQQIYRRRDRLQSDS